MINLFDHPIELNEVALRHRRNLIVASTIVGIIALTPGVSPADIKIFGLSFEHTPPNWIWSGSIALISYFLVTYFIDIDLIYRTWSSKVMPIFSGSMRLLWGRRVNLNTMGRYQFIRAPLNDELKEAARSLESTDKALDFLLEENSRDIFVLVSAHDAQDTETKNKVTIKKGDPYIMVRDVKVASPKEGDDKAHSVNFIGRDLRAFRRHISQFFLWQGILPLAGGLMVVLICIYKLINL